VVGGCAVTPEPRNEGDYADRQVEAARRVLVDVGQVLASFGDAIVVVGGWVPDLLLPAAEHEHIGSIDVDLALDAAKLGDGRYAELLKLLLDTRRYERGDKDFQLVTTVDLGDDEAPVRVEVEFLAPADVKLKKNHPKLVEGFRVLQFPACAAAFGHPQSIELEGVMISGAPNTVHLRVASLPDFIIMKAHAVGGRDKPKDVYDLCYCLDEYPDAITIVAADWRARRGDPLVSAAIEILRVKFQTVEHFGPKQLAEFHDAIDADERAMHARRAFELAQKLLSAL
jgi:Nucleotidyl transferase AbiEii toxin, Type IV TA system